MENTFYILFICIYKCSNWGKLLTENSYEISMRNLLENEVSYGSWKNNLLQIWIGIQSKQKDNFGVETELKTAKVLLLLQTKALLLSEKKPF